jgi:hypothetical protein
MPFKRAGCAGARQELEKLILPSPSGDDSPDGCRAGQGEADAKISKISENLRGNITGCLLLGLSSNFNPYLFINN